MTGRRIFIPNLHRNGAYVLAVMANKSGYEVFTSTDHPGMPYTRCRWVQDYLYIAPPPERNGSPQQLADYVAALVAFMRRNAIDIVFPTNDADIRIVFAAREQFAEYSVWAPDEGLFETLSSKFSSLETLGPLGVSIPAHQAVSTLEGAQILLSRWGYPVIAKRAHSTGGRGVAVCRSQAELVRFLEAGQPVVLQEWLSGNDEVSFHFLFDRQGNTILRFSLRKYRHLAPSVSTAISVIDDPAEISLVETALKSLNAVGFFVVQMRFCPRLKAYKFVEVNCRFGSNTRMLCALVPRLFSLFAQVMEGGGDLTFVEVKPSVRCISVVEDCYGFVRNTYALLLDRLTGGHRSQIVSFRNFAGQFFLDMFNFRNKRDLLWRRLGTDTIGILRMYRAMFRAFTLSRSSIENMKLAAVWCPPAVDAAAARRRGQPAAGSAEDERPQPPAQHHTSGR